MKEAGGGGGGRGKGGGGRTLQSDRSTELNGREASDAGSFRVCACVMFAQTDERRRFDVSDEDNSLSTISRLRAQNIERLPKKEKN